MSARRTVFGSAPPSPAVPPLGMERRRSERVETVIKATVRQAGLQDASPIKAKAVDISDGGVSLLARRNLPLGSRVLLDMECELPLRVHLGFDADSLVIDGPMHTHLVRVAGVVVRAQRAPGRRWQLGIQLCEENSRFDELQSVKYYVDHLREQDSWTI